MSATPLRGFVTCVGAVMTGSPPFLVISKEYANINISNPLFIHDFSFISVRLPLLHALLLQNKENGQMIGCSCKFRPQSNKCLDRKIDLFLLRMKAICFPLLRLPLHLDIRSSLHPSLLLLLLLLLLVALRTKVYHPTTLLLN